MVHRLLAVAIGADASYPELLDKHKSQVSSQILSNLFPFKIRILSVQAICNNLNFRHRMAQYAGRASVGLHTQVSRGTLLFASSLATSSNMAALFVKIFFKHRVSDEDGYVLFVRKNALQILIPKYGLEGTIYLTDDKSKSLFVFNEKVPQLQTISVLLTNDSATRIDNLFSL